MAGEENNVLANIVAETPTRTQRKTARSMICIGVGGPALFVLSEAASILTSSFTWWIAVPFGISLVLVGIAGWYWNSRLRSWMAKNWLP
jgi:type IV secretory pathway TrbD component